MGIKGIFLISLKNTRIYIYYIRREYIILWVNFSLPIILLNKFAYKNAILLVSLKNDKNLHCIVVIEKNKYCLLHLKVTNLYYIVGIIENNKSSYYIVVIEKNKYCLL